MVAQQTLTLYVWVRILDPLPKIQVERLGFFLLLRFFLWYNIFIFMKGRALMFKVTVNNTIISAQRSERLSDVLRRGGLSVEHPCGGKGSCKKCLVTVNGEDVLACQYIIESDISVSLPEQGGISSFIGAEETGRITDNICYVLDLGTTTLVLAKVSLDEKKIISSLTRTNPQRTFGADVMSRIEYCRNNSVKELQSVVVSAVNDMLREMGDADGKKMFVAGNTTMLHILLGEDCSSMGVYPYTPSFLGKRIVPAEDIGLSYLNEVEALPSISAFVGADIVAGLNYVPMPSAGKFNLLVDLGTNAEIVLFSQTSVLCTSAAAGPCFEGANISCGMSAVSGAVCAYEKGEATTVDNAPAKGICGTGLVDVVAYIIYSGKIDVTGLMDCEQFRVAENVFVTQQDIRQYQLAKSAVHAGIETMLRIKGINYDDIEELYISGGFSTKLNIHNAAATGLILKELEDKTKAVNNSSLLGAVKFACEGSDLSFYSKKAAYIDLSTNPGFKKSFIEHMDFKC